MNYTLLSDKLLQSFIGEFYFEIKTNNTEYFIDRLTEIRAETPIYGVYSDRVLKELLDKLLDSSLKPIVLRWASHLDFILTIEEMKEEVINALLASFTSSTALLSDRDQITLASSVTKEYLESNPILVWIGLFVVYFPAISGNFKEL